MIRRTLHPWQYVALTFLIIMGGYYAYIFFNSQNEVNRFIGRITGLEENTISVFGVFKTESGDVPESLSTAQNFTFRVNESTQIQKETIQWPDDLGILGENFDLKDLPHQREPGSLEDLKVFFGKDTVFIEASFPVAINNAQNPVASTLLYRILSFPISSPNP